jgi:transcription termination factor Rho
MEHSVFDPSELKASPLADLHVIANELGLDGFRRLRKDELIEAILGARAQQTPLAEDQDRTPATERRGRRRTQAAGEQPAASAPQQERVAEGVVELLGNGSAFLRIAAGGPSDEDVYISAAQVRRCELISGDRVSGPVRTPRRSERYPSLVRVDAINGVSAETLERDGRYEDLSAVYPSEQLLFGSETPTLLAIERLTPIGLGSRALIVGGTGAGKTRTLMELAGALAAREDLQTTLVLVGVRPEEITDWRSGSLQPLVAASFAASADTQARAVARAIEPAKRLAVSGAHAVVLIDTLDALHPQAARKALAAARRLADGGSLTLIATATRSFGGESTVIALAGTGQAPGLDLCGSATLMPELLVGEQRAREITVERAEAWAAKGR